MKKVLSINIEKQFPELKRLKYMMKWCSKSKNTKTKIRIIKHCVKIANKFCRGKHKWKVKVLRK